MKRFIKYLLVLLIIGFAWGFYTYSPQLSIANGYVARMTCTCTFAAGRDQKEIAAHNFFYSVLGLVDAKVDQINKSVTASLFGLKSQRAIFKPGIGCVLLDGEDDHHVTFPPLAPIDTPARFWPRNSSELVTGINMNALHKAMDHAFDHGDTVRKRTTSLLVIYKDSLIAEKYAAPFTVRMPQLGWSMTKSWMNTMIGMMVMDSLTSLEDRNLFAEWIDRRKEINVRSLLQMNSGLEWKEIYTEISDATLMLYDSEDVAKLPISKPQEHPAGEKWYYSSATSNLLSTYAKRKLSNTNSYLTYLHEGFFRPLGMSSAFVETDEVGTMIVSSYGYASARDWARFGLLYLNDGMHANRRLLPSGWVDFTRQTSAGSDGEYGAHFWLNRGGEYPDAPADMFYADGYLGQFVYIIPSRDVVIVRLGGDGAHFDGNTLIRDVLAALPPIK
jgi:CubicO group peptidase (beta-lactamase class C family)